MTRVAVVVAVGVIRAGRLVSSSHLDSLQVTVPPLVIDGPRGARGRLPYDGPVTRIPSCSLCKDGDHVLGAICSFCGALPGVRTPRASDRTRGASR